MKVGADYLEKEAYEDALRELEKASKFAEAASTVYFLLGKTYRGLGRNEDAIKAFEKADEMMEKDEASAWKMLAKQYYGRGDTKEQKKKTQKYISL